MRSAKAKSAEAKSAEAKSAEAKKSEDSMPILFCDSYDHYQTTDLPIKYASVNASFITGAGTGRNGTQALRLTGVTNPNLSVVVGNIPTVYTEVAYRMQALPASDQPVIVYHDAGSWQMELRITPTGELRLTRNTTPVAVTSGLGLSINTYHHIGLMVTVHDTAGIYEVRVNGVQKLFATGTDTKNTANAYVTDVRLYGYLGVNGTVDYDDLIIASDGFSGDCAVKAIFPQGAGNYSQWSPSAGLGYQCVDETLVNGDTDYVISATPGQRNSYDFATIGGGLVKAVQQVSTMRKDDAGARNAKQFVRAGGTDYDGANIVVAGSYVMQRQVLTTNPATGAAWTNAGLDAAEFGTLMVS